MRHFFMVAALPLMGCMSEAGDTPANQPAGGACAAAELQVLIGQPESALAAMTFSSPTRIIHPRQPVTMDLNPSRLNILIDDSGIVSEVRCG
jgi:hypothetical protein